MNEADRAGSRRAGDAAPILSIDVGATGIKAALLDHAGRMTTERVRVETPRPATPKKVVEAIVELVRPLGPYGRVSVGFPGVVRKGKVLTAPNLGTEFWAGFDLVERLSRRLGKPVRALNDADMQGLGAVRRKGLEVVITLGTGFGSALFVDGVLCPHLEIGHLPFRKGETYDEQLGNRALQRVGRKKWNRRVKLAIDALRTLTNFDRLYVGGGNAHKIAFDLGDDIEIVPNEMGIRGGVWLWKAPERALATPVCGRGFGPGEARPSARARRARGGGARRRRRPGLRRRGAARGARRAAARRAR